MAVRAVARARDAVDNRKLSSSTYALRSFSSSFDLVQKENCRPFDLTPQINKGCCREAGDIALDED
jgi:hypothetical protein